MIRVVIDTNNNYDFSDEVPFIPEKELPSYENRNAEILPHLRTIVFEKYTAKGIEQDSVRIFVYDTSEDRFLFYSIARHGILNFYRKEFAVIPQHFSRMAGETSLLETNGTNGVERWNEMVNENEYVELNGEYYLFEGVNPFSDIAVFVKAPPGRVYSTQVGFFAPVFTGRDFTTGETVSLEEFHGKYVFLDFWSTGCGPCIAEMPHMKWMYDKIDKTSVEFVSIIRKEDDPADIRQLIEKYGLDWPQIYSGEGFDVNELYRVTGYPTTLLIGPDGKVFSKGWRERQVENFFRKEGLFKDK